VKPDPLRFEQIISMDNLYQAWRLARKGKTEQAAAIRYELNLWQHLGQVAAQLRNRTYRVGQYRIFTITEPKTRLIMALPLRDRVVQHALCLPMRPLLEEHFVSANAANRNDKGTHYAVRLLTAQMVHANRRYHQLYCLKCDISGFFYNIDRAILKQKLLRLPMDEGAKWLIDTIIDSTPDVNGKSGKGMPIGNLTSQFWAIYYLSDLDHFIKETLGIKYYVRYMDDWTLLHPDKYYLRYCRQAIADFLAVDCALELNRKTQIFNVRQGIDFLGWHFYLGATGKVIKIMRRESKIKRRRQNKRWRRAYAGACTYDQRQAVFTEGRQSLVSWLGHARFGHTYRLRQKLSRELVLK